MRLGEKGRRGYAPSVALWRRMDSCLRRNDGNATRPVCSMRIVSGAATASASGRVGLA